MLVIKAKLKIPRTAYKLEVRGTLKLPFEARQTGGLKARLTSGEEVEVMLPRGEILRGGDFVTASDGRVIEVVAVPERLLHIESKALAMVAYHLGDRHVPVQVGEEFLRIVEDHALEQMVRTLGAHVTHVEAPFEPEAGAHAAGHHQHDEKGHGGKRHDHVDDHDHEHCDHPGHHHHK